MNKKHIDFLGIGVQKAGTTWLHQNLKQLQEFNLPQIKELHYFDRSSAYPSFSELSDTHLTTRIWRKSFYSIAIKKIIIDVIQQNWKSLRFHLNWYFSNYSDKWYLSLFKDLEGYTGEVTPAYSMLNEKDIRRIHRLLPDVKLVLMLRNPIERAWSHYRFSNRTIDDFNFEKADYNEIIKFMESKGQSLRSDYIKTIDNYSKVFRDEQILIGFYDALSDNPKMLMNDVLKHICGDASISINHLNLKKEVNKSRRIDCPKEIEDYLKNRYHDQIKELSEKYGGYFTKWYEESYAKKSINEKIKLLPTMYIKS